VLTTRPPAAPWVERMGPRAIVVRVGLPVRRPRQLYAPLAAVAAPVLAHRADLVHAHLGEDLAVLPLAALAARVHRLPLVVTVHCSPSFTLQARDLRTAILRTLGGRIERRTERRAAATLVYTSRLADRIAREVGGAVHVIPRGVDRQAFSTAVGAAFPEFVARPRVIFLGRIVRAKGVDALVEAAARITTRGAEFLLVGDGPDRRHVERLARRAGVAERVHVTGFVPHERVPSVLASADLLVLPSLYEELGTVLVEAMQVGLPTVASRVGGVPEVVEHGVTGLLVTPGDPAALATAIDAILSQPDLARRLGENARRRAAKHDLRHVGAQVHALYQRLVDDHRRARMRRERLRVTCEGLRDHSPSDSGAVGTDVERLAGAEAPDADPGDAVSARDVDASADPMLLAVREMEGLNPHV